MTLIQQARLGIISAPPAIFRGRRQFFIFLSLYLVAGFVVFGAFGALLVSNQEAIKQALLDYFLPKSWQGISEKLFLFLFESQTKVVIANLIASGSLVMASVFLFPLKEKCSAVFEKESTHTQNPPQEFPLWMQAIEEGKLLFLYISIQSLILAIGYYPYAWCNWLSNTISIAFLMFSFSIDLISPGFQRHRIKYAASLSLLAKRPVLCFCFGALFTLPLMFLGKWILDTSELQLAETAAVLFLVNLLFITVAIPAGTWIATRLLNEAQSEAPTFRKHRFKIYGALAFVLLVSGSFHYLIGSSLHHKSQIFKCEYQLDWDSFKVDWPSLIALTNGTKEAKIEFDLLIHNPTPFDLHIENSYLEVLQMGNVVSHTRIQEFAVESGETVKQAMRITTKIDRKALSGFRELLDGWSVQLKVDLLPGIPFIIQLV